MVAPIGVLFATCSGNSPPGASPKLPRHRPPQPTIDRRSAGGLPVGFVSAPAPARLHIRYLTD
jgi:hypothetical protein